MTRTKSPEVTAKLFALSSLALGAAVFAIAWTASVDGRIEPPTVAAVEAAVAVPATAAATAATASPAAATTPTTTRTQVAHSTAPSKRRVDLGNESFDLAALQAGGPRLRAADSFLDFGTVAPGQRLQKVFVLHNDGRKPLKIVRVKPSCGCATVTFDKEIPPGGEGLMEVAVSASSVKPGKLSHHIEVTSNDPNAWMLMIEATVDANAPVAAAPATARLADNALLTR